MLDKIHHFVGYFFIHLFVIGVLFGILTYTSGSLISGIIGYVSIDIFSWSYWWSSIAGKFNMRTIFETTISNVRLFIRINVGFSYSREY